MARTVSTLDREARIQFDKTAQALDHLADMLMGLPEYDPCPDYEEDTGRSEYTNADDLAHCLPGWEPWEPDEDDDLDGFHEDDGD